VESHRDTHPERDTGGWLCELELDGIQGYQTDLTPALARLESEFQQSCQAQGGHFSCPEPCYADMARYCDARLSDANKKCSDSRQCQGGCVIEVADFNQLFPDLADQDLVGFDCQGQCQGTCARYPIRTCDLEFQEQFYELVDGIIIERPELACD